MKIMMKTLDDFTDIFTVNTKMTFVVGEGNYAGIYDSRVEDFDDEGNIIAAIPSSSGTPVPLLPGTKFEVSFMGPDSRYKFDTSVIGRVKNGNIYFLKLQKPENITRNQLRDFFRVSTRIKSTITIYDLKEQGKDKDVAIVSNESECTVIDISGGGCKLLLDAEVVKGQHVSVDLTSILGTNGIIEGKIVRTSHIENKHYASVQFTFKKETERDPLIRYVFRRQIEMRQMQ